MNTRVRIALLVTVLAGAAACSSPITANSANPDVSAPQLTTAGDSSTTARGGGNLMGGN